MKITTYKWRSGEYHVFKTVDVPYGCHNTGQSMLTDRYEELRDFYVWWNSRNPDRPVDIAGIFPERQARLNDTGPACVVTPNGRFDSMITAAESHGISQATLYKLFRSNPNEYYRAGRGRLSGPQADRTRKQVQTPEGVFDTMIEATTALGITANELKRRLRDDPDSYYVIQE